MNKKEKNKVNSFLKSFSVRGSSQTYLWSSERNAMKKDTLDNVIYANEQYNCDAYFCVNPGRGMKDAEISHLICNFVDLDAGKENGSYLTLTKVKTFKRKALASIRCFGVKPTYIVETRNGYHLYWVYDAPVIADYANRKIWQSKQNFIQGYFAALGGDSSVNKVCQIMRIPYTSWFKTWSGKSESFKTGVIEKNAKVSFATLFGDTSTAKPVTPVKAPSINKFIDVNPVQNMPTLPVAVTLPTVPAQPANSQNAQGNNFQYKDELVAFLRDMSTILYSKNMKYLSKQCTDFANKVQFG